MFSKEYIVDKKTQVEVKNTSGVRYGNRRHAFVRRFGVVWGNVLHHFWWLTHNCVVHPLIGLLPFEACFRLHDYTSDRLNEW